MNALIATIYQLTKGGYKVYPSAQDQTFVIEDSRGVLSKVIYCKASSTKEAAILNLNTQNQAQAFLENFGFFLAIEPEEPRAWLIPISEFPKHTRTIRLSSRFDRYLVKDCRESHSLTTKTIQQEVKNRLTKKVGDIQQEDLEYLLRTDV